MSLTRRELMQYGLTASGALLLPLQFPNKALADVTSASPTSPTTTPWASFTTPLTFPEVLQPYKSDADPDGFDYYEIVLKKKTRKFAGDNNDYEFWGYNGMFPGPTIKKKAYRQVKVDFVNKLGKTNLNWQGSIQEEMEDIRAVIHNHGMPSLPEYDGFAEDYILPDQFKTYIYPNNRAATYWYHDHQAGRTMRNVGMGLVGMWIVQDETEFDLNLPRGKYDVPLMFQTPPFTWIQAHKPSDPDDRSYTPPTLINGVYQPLLQVDTHKYRFRLLNATANQLYTLVLVSYDQSKNQPVDESIIVIGTDSGLRNSSVCTETLEFVMADRYEIIIDFSHREIGSRMALVERDQGVDTPLICFEVSQQVKDESELPLLLRPYRPVDPDIASPNHSPDKEFTFYFDGTGPCDESGQAGTINHYLWDKDHIETSPGLNTWQKWRLTNPLDGPVHPIHIHLLDFQIVRRTKNGVEVPLPVYEDKSWKDVFNLGPKETIDIVGQFGPHVGKYMMHCHNLDHEDCDMMTNFEVVDPTGQDIPTDPLAVPAQNLPPDYQFKKSTYQPYSTQLTPPFA